MRSFISRSALTVNFVTKVVYVLADALLHLPSGPDNKCRDDGIRTPMPHLSYNAICERVSFVVPWPVKMATVSAGDATARS